MDVEDALLGKVTLVVTSSLFVVFVVWINSYPFIEEGTCVAMATNRPDWLVIGISGVTCGGKTTLSSRLAAALAAASVLHQDRYFLPDEHPAHVPVPGLGHNNYDVLTALDMDQMLADALSVLDGDLEKAHDTSAGGTVCIKGKRILIIEGFTALNYRPLYELCDLRYYFVLEYGECAARRALRLYDPPDVAGYFERCVWPEHLRYRAELECDPYVVQLDGTRPDVFARVMADLRAQGAADLADLPDLTELT